MKKAFMGAIVISLALAALPAVAAENNPPQQAAGPMFEQRKAEILNRIDQRIARDQQEKACIQTANNHEALKACRDKFGPPNRQGGPGGQGGMGGAGGQGHQ
jgi:hypothetical protein